jgi:ribonuclease HI
MTCKTYWVDGGCRNQGAANRITWEGYGSFCDDEGRITHFELPQAATNNEAEYMALIELLKTLPKVPRDGDAPTVYTDSRLLVGHLTKNWKCRAQNLLILVEYSKMLLFYTKTHLKWVSRTEMVKRLGH